MAHNTRFSEAELERMAERFGHGDVDLVGEPQTVESDDAGGTAVLSIRLPRSVIIQLKALAEQRRIGATVLARDFIIEGIVTQPHRLAGSIPVAEILRLVSSHGFVTPEVPEPVAPPKPSTRKSLSKTSAASVKKAAKAVSVTKSGRATTADAATKHPRTAQGRSRRAK